MVLTGTWALRAVLDFVPHVSVRQTRLEENEPQARNYQRDWKRVGEEAPEAISPDSSVWGAGKGEGAGVPGVLRCQGWDLQARGRLGGGQGGETRPERAWLCGESIHMSGPGSIFVVPGTGQSESCSVICVVSSAPVCTPKCSKTLASTRTPSFHRRAVCPLLVDCTSTQSWWFRR